MKETMSEATAAQDVAAPAPEPVALLDDPARDVPNGREPAAPARQNTENSEAPSKTTEGDSGGEADPEQVEADKGLTKGKNYYARKIDQLTRAEAEWKRIAQQATEALTRQTPPAQQPANAAPAQPSGPPTPEQFNDYGLYLKAMSEYAGTQAAQGQIKQWQQGLQTTLDQQQRLSQEARANAEFSTRLAADKAGIADYDAVVSAARIELTPHVEQAIKSVDVPAKVIHYLAQNPEIVESLNGMQPGKAFIEMGKISAKLATATSRPSNAPAPGVPVTPKSGASNNWYRPDMTGEQYAAELRKRSKGR